MHRAIRCLHLAEMGWLKIVYTAAPDYVNKDYLLRHRHLGVTKQHLTGWLKHCGGMGICPESGCEIVARCTFVSRHIIQPYILIMAYSWGSDALLPELRVCVTSHLSLVVEM